MRLQARALSPALFEIPISGTSLLNSAMAVYRSSLPDGYVARADRQAGRATPHASLEAAACPSMRNSLHSRQDTAKVPRCRQYLSKRRMFLATL